MQELASLAQGKSPLSPLSKDGPSEQVSDSSACTHRSLPGIAINSLAMLPSCCHGDTWLCDTWIYTSKESNCARQSSMRTDPAAWRAAAQALQACKNSWAEVSKLPIALDDHSIHEGDELRHLGHTAAVLPLHYT